MATEAEVRGRVSATLPLVVVEWDDAWVKADEAVVMSEIHHTHKPTAVTTIGWLLREDEAGVSIANEYYDETYRGRTFIPKAMVRKLTRFALSRPRKRR